MKNRAGLNNSPRAAKNWGHCLCAAEWDLPLEKVCSALPDWAFRKDEDKGMWTLTRDT